MKLVEDVFYYSTVTFCIFVVVNVFLNLLGVR